MALDAAALKTAMKSKIEAATAPLESPNADAVLQALAEAIVEHFTANAVVQPTSLVDGAMLPVTGTGTLE
jgi:hypothetical protein